ncbi:MAG: hypothetical protein FJX76_03465 [Armatimonadetes bacterium]|nr:hypothetical protein [Armatimonadota bacterium]
MWPVSHFRKGPRTSDSEEMTRLSCILHFLARRNDHDEGFVVTTQCLSTSQFEYFTRANVQPGEVLRLKVVSGPHVLELKAVVQTVMEPGQVGYGGRGPMMSFLDLTDYERRVIYNMVQRFRAPIAASEAFGA